MHQLHIMLSIDRLRCFFVLYIPRKEAMPPATGHMSYGHSLLVVKVNLPVDS